MLAKRDERILEPLPKAGALGTGCVGRDLRILTTLNPERGLWVDRGEGEKKVQCWEREVNCGGREGNRRKRKEEERNSKSPVQMEATPPKASPASWGPSPSERIELPQAHSPWGDPISWSNKKARSP